MFARKVSQRYVTLFNAMGKQLKRRRRVTEMSCNGMFEEKSK